MSSDLRLDNLPLDTLFCIAHLCDTPFDVLHLRSACNSLYTLFSDDQFWWKYYCKLTHRTPAFEKRSSALDKAWFHRLFRFASGNVAYRIVAGKNLTPVPGLPRVHMMACCSFRERTSCAAIIAPSGELWTFGDSWCSNLGRGEGPGKAYLPHPVKFAKDDPVAFRSVKLSAMGGMALSRDGYLYYWGNDQPTLVRIDHDLLLGGERCKKYHLTRFTITVVTVSGKFYLWRTGDDHSARGMHRVYSLAPEQRAAKSLPFPVHDISEGCFITHSPVSGEEEIYAYANYDVHDDDGSNFMYLRVLTPRPQTVYLANSAGSIRMHLTRDGSFSLNCDSFDRTGDLYPVTFVRFYAKDTSQFLAMDQQGHVYRWGVYTIMEGRARYEKLPLCLEELEGKIVEDFCISLGISLFCVKNRQGWSLPRKVRAERGSGEAK